MNSDLLLNALLILLFICVGGVFAAAEMALVSLRDSRSSSSRTAAPVAVRSPG